jgi:putative glutamine amidotransferase
MPKPKIGITVDYNDSLTCYESPYNYAAAVEMAGGIPILLPYRSALISEYVDLMDGIIFSGGNDLDPKSWGESYHAKANAIDPQREKFEMALMAEVEKRRMPTLGICLGSQVMNVYRGGSLHQFLPDLSRPDPIEHRKVNGDPGRDGAGSFNRHTVILEQDSLACQAIGKPEISSNTSHKQAINRVGKGLRVIAKAPDGIIEGIEDPSFPLWVGVQWHPERLHLEKEHLALFELLVERCSKPG